MNYGYFKQGDFNCDELESVMIENKEYHLAKYLHGTCELFALALYDWLSEIGIQAQLCSIFYDMGLVHAYVTVQKENTTYYLDVRGITTDADIFFDEFADFWSWDGYLDGDEEQVLHVFEQKEVFLNYLLRILELEASHFEQKEVQEELNGILSFLFLKENMLSIFTE